MLVDRTMTAAIAIAMLTLIAVPSLAADTTPKPDAALEAMAQQKFGPALSAAERKLIHFAPIRDVPWIGPRLASKPAWDKIFVVATSRERRGSEKTRPHCVSAKIQTVSLEAGIQTVSLEAGIQTVSLEAGIQTVSLEAGVATGFEPLQ